jgi:hypothetical protein
MFRIDPLTTSGIFDHEFYTSEEYNNYKKIVEEYLINEGFRDMEKEFTIDLLDHTWIVKPCFNTKKKGPL